MASWNPNGTYVIEDGEIVGTERNGKDIYHFEIEDDETLVFNALGMDILDTGRMCI